MELMDEQHVSVTLDQLNAVQRQYPIRIYQLTINDKRYIGSTADSVDNRVSRHKTDAVFGPASDRPVLQELKNYIEKGGGFNVTTLGTFLVSSEEEQLRHEQRFIDELKPELNVFNAIVTDRKSVKAVQNKKYAEKNKCKHQCIHCNYSTSNRKDLSKHFLTKRHKDLMIVNQNNKSE